MADPMEARVVELEIQLSYAAERLNDLDEALRAQAQRTLTLEEEVRLLREALKRVARPAAEGEHLDSFDDPVPSSG